MVEYYLHTGRYSTGELYHNEGLVSNGIGSIGNQNILTSDVSINGQTLLETEASITTVGQREIINNSGDFFLSGGLLRETTGFLEFNYSPAKLKYDLIESGSRVFYESENFTDLKTGFSGRFGNLEEKQIYLNGIKLVSGEHYLGDINNNFSWNDSVSTGFLTGILFGLPKKNQVYITGSYDVMGVRFNKGTTIGFINGIKSNKTEFLESSSIIFNLIESGKNDVVEFSLPVESELIFL